MLDLLKQRLQSKTYWAAVIGALLTGLDAQSGFFSQYFPAEYRPFVPMLWPVLMLAMREVTNSALADK